MKKVMMGVVVMMWCISGWAQTKVDEQRMDQDILVAENILSTLMRQSYGKRSYFPIEVKGAYTPGFGVTFRVPQGGFFNKMMIGGFDAPELVTMDIRGDNTVSYSYSYTPDPDEGEPKDQDNATKVKSRTEAKTPKGRPAPVGKPVIAQVVRGDSIDAAMDSKFLEIAKNFLADYGDVLSQLKPNERILVTNRAGGFDADVQFRFPGMESRRSLVSAEATRDDITQMKQGKITRNQFLAKLKTINSVMSDDLDPDLEVLSSMFNRLYREDLSKTYFVQGDVGYERLKDFGVIYYMNVYSSYEEGGDMFVIPSASLRGVDQKERDAKVKELYPRFENELKDNMVEYGRTLRSLGDDEVLAFNVRLTRCAGCGIPATLELTIKNSALKDYSSGKATKEATLAKVNVKKTGVQ